MMFYKVKFFTEKVKNLFINTSLSEASPLSKGARGKPLIARKKQWQQDPFQNLLPGQAHVLPGWLEFCFFVILEFPLWELAKHNLS